MKHKIRCLLEKFYKKILLIPWFEPVAKWFVIGTVAFAFNIMFLIQPLIIEEIKPDLKIVPINGSFTVQTRSIKPWTSVVFCSATGAWMYMEIVSKDGFHIPVQPVPEPFGFNDSTGSRVLSITHLVPGVARVGD